MELEALIRSFRGRSLLSAPSLCSALAPATAPSLSLQHPPRIPHPNSPSHSLQHSPPPAPFGLWWIPAEVVRRSAVTCPDGIVHGIDKLLVPQSVLDEFNRRRSLRSITWAPLFVLDGFRISLMQRRIRIILLCSYSAGSVLEFGRISFAVEIGATPENARKYNGNLIKLMATNKGTPMKPDSASIGLSSFRSRFPSGSAG